MIHGIPIFGTLISLALSFCVAIPFYFIWNALAPTYFSMLPKHWLDIPFWDAVGMFMLLPIFNMVIQNLTPKIVTVSQSQKVKGKSE